MKKILYFLWTLILLTTGCSDEKAEFTLKGDINGLVSDTLLVFYQVPEYKLDTIFVSEGMFNYTFTPDTSVVFSLIFNAEQVYPIYAEKGKTVEIFGKIDSLNVKGDGDNLLFSQINAYLLKLSSQQIQSKVDSIIQANSRSFTNLYLIDKYYVQNRNLDYKKLESVIGKLDGIIKDTPYMLELQAKIKELDSRGKSTTVHSLINKDKEGNAFKWHLLKDKYVLIDFWASWHPESVIEQDSLVSVLRALKKERFAVVSLSLDLDKEVWLAAADRDTTQWVQICDFKGWNNPTVKNLNIRSLPKNVLLDTSRRIVASDIRGQELIDKVKELIRKDKEKEKEKKKRKK